MHNSFVGKKATHRVACTLFGLELRCFHNITLGEFSLHFQEILSINVLDCNDRPSEITLTSSLAASENALYTIEISENSPSGTSLVNMSVVDDDVGQQHTCVLPTGGDYFYVKSLSKSSSEVYVSQDADLDYERHLNAPITGTVKVSFVIPKLNCTLSQ